MGVGDALQVQVEVLPVLAGILSSASSTAWEQFPQLCGCQECFVPSFGQIFFLARAFFKSVEFWV